MVFKKKIFFSLLMMSVVSPQLIAATIAVPGIAASSVSSVNLVERPSQQSTMGHVASVSFANPILSQFSVRPQIDFLTRPEISFDRPMLDVMAISAVPIPAALWLFLPAVLGFFGLRQRSLAADKRIAHAH